MKWNPTKWFRPRPILMHPYGAEERGFKGKNMYVDQWNLIPEASVIFDVGAWTGDTALEYLKVFPKSTIYAFEPFPGSYSALTQAVRPHPSVRTFPLAVADKRGTKLLHSYPESVTNSLLSAKPDWFTELQALEVESITLDEFCREEGISTIDILKMDIQGAEKLALQGATELLKTKAIKLIYAEVSFVPQYNGQVLCHHLTDFLENYGYDFYDFYNFSYAKSGRLRWGDAIFLPATHSSK